MKDTHVEILVNGRTVKQYQHGAATYIEARAGTEYSIKIKNDTYCRKLAVITVDGLNVITGNPQPDGVGQGYILPARDSLDIKGFRKDSDSVGAFKFCKKSGSYCIEKGLKGNNGVIGVRLYEEKVQEILYRSFSSLKSSNSESIPKGPAFPRTDPMMWYTTSTSDMNDNGPVASAASPVRNSDVRDIKCCYVSSVSPDFDLGTTWGKKINDSVTYVDFEADKGNFLDHVIYYDTKENLEKIGISFKETTQVYPKAFGAFATPPKGWRG